MKIEDFEKIMGEDNSLSLPEQDNALMGLNIIAKYLPNAGIEATGHDVIYSVGVEELVNAGITEEDAKKLRDINWMIDEDSLSCFV